jgi:hypothetical protein
VDAFLASSAKPEAGRPVGIKHSLQKWFIVVNYWFPARIVRRRNPCSCGRNHSESILSDQVEKSFNTGRQIHAGYKECIKVFRVGLGHCGSSP